MLLAAGCSDSDDRAEPIDVAGNSDVADSGTIELRWTKTLGPTAVSPFGDDEIFFALHYDGDDYEVVSQIPLFDSSSRFVDDRYFADIGSPVEERFEESWGLEAPGFSEVEESDVRVRFEHLRAAVGGVDPWLSEIEIIEQLEILGATFGRDGDSLIGVMPGEGLRTANADEVPMGFSFLVSDQPIKDLIPAEVEFEIEIVDGFVSSVELQLVGDATAGPVEVELVARHLALEERIEIPDTSAADAVQEVAEQALAGRFGDPLEGLSEEEKSEFEGLLAEAGICRPELTEMVLDRTPANIESSRDCFIEEGEGRLAELTALIQPQ